MDRQSIDKLKNLFDSSVDAGLIPGAVILAGRGDEIFVHQAFGWAQLIPYREEMTPDTWFDVASLTKLMGPWLTLLPLIQEGSIALEDKLCDLVPYPVHPGLREVTVFHLLTHTAGLKQKQYADSFGPTREDRVRGLAMVPPEHPLGGQVLYSDLSFIFLGEIVAHARRAPFEAVCAELWGRLGMRATRYNPPQGTYCAATEIKRGQLRRGRVHDEVASQLMGVSGHAGIFSTAADIAKFCAAILPPGQSGLFDEGWLRRSYTNQTAHLGEDRALGWITYRERPEGNIVGHTGFTGTSIWMDTATREYVILLSNRVHPSRENMAMGDIRQTAFGIVFGQ